MMEATSYILYFLTFLGIYLVFWDSFRITARRLRARRLVKRGIKKDRGTEKRGGEFTASEYISAMLAIVSGKDDIDNVTKFYEKSFLCASGAFILSYACMTAKVAPIAGIVGLLIPFVYYWSKLQDIRTEASREGEILATELLNNYKIYHYNMQEAIRISAESISREAPRSRRMLIMLSYELNTISAKEDVKKAVERFKFGIDTTWSGLLATNIELAQVEGMRVTAAMEDLVQTIIKARKTMEETKRQGSEGRRMLKFLVPGIYLITIVSSNRVFGMSIHEFFSRQFRTDTGSTWFLAVACAYITSILVSGFIARNKMDI